MSEPAKTIKLNYPKEKRMICISDVHGNIDLFLQLLKKINFTDDDILLILGDLYTKGPKGNETLKYMMEIYKQPNVHIIRGNSDWITDDLEEVEQKWIENLPHIIETDKYIFVHGGLTSNNLSEQDGFSCMKNNAFMEKDLFFDKYVITGHWPVYNYCHEIPCNNPIINHKKRIISIDGGTIKRGGQLNAFIIKDDIFSFDYVDYFIPFLTTKNQEEQGGTLNITWNDRFIECVENGGEFSIYKHLKTGKLISIPNSSVWTDEDGKLCTGNLATDYYLPINTGDTIFIIEKFKNKFFAKKNGVMGWVNN